MNFEKLIKKETMDFATIEGKLSKQGVPLPVLERYLTLVKMWQDNVGTNLVNMFEDASTYDEEDDYKKLFDIIHEEYRNMRGDGDTLYRGIRLSPYDSEHEYFSENMTVGDGCDVTSPIKKAQSWTFSKGVAYEFATQTDERDAIGIVFKITVDEDIIENIIYFHLLFDDNVMNSNRFAHEQEVIVYSGGNEYKAQVYEMYVNTYRGWENVEPGDNPMMYMAKNLEGIADNIVAGDDINFAKIIGEIKETSNIYGEGELTDFAERIAEEYNKYEFSVEEYNAFFNFVEDSVSLNDVPHIIYLLLTNKKQMDFFRKNIDILEELYDWLRDNYDDNDLDEPIGAMIKYYGLNKDAGDMDIMTHQTIPAKFGNYDMHTGQRLLFKDID